MCGHHFWLLDNLHTLKSPTVFFITGKIYHNKTITEKELHG